MSGFVVNVESGFLDKLSGYDPTEALIARLSGENDDMSDDDETHKSASMARLAELVEMLPLVEQDLLRMQAQGVRQQDAAEIFGWTQAAVSYRLTRAQQRLRFLQTFPNPTESQLRADLQGVLTPQQINVLWDLSHTSCQTHTATRLGVSQGRVGHSLRRVRTILSQRTEPQLQTYRVMVEMLADKRNHNLLLVLPGPQGYQGRGPEFLKCLSEVPAANDH